MPTITLPAGTTSWTVPSDWTGSNTIVCLGPGGNGAKTTGGGGGAYAAVYNQGLSPGSLISVQVSAGGSQNATWWNSPTTVLAAAGLTAVVATPGAGGAAANCVGSTIYGGGVGSPTGTGAGGGPGGGPGQAGGRVQLGRPHRHRPARQRV